jgi:hypothetical protein
MEDDSSILRELKQININLTRLISAVEGKGHGQIRDVDNYGLDIEKKIKAARQDAENKLLSMRASKGANQP